MKIIRSKGQSFTEHSNDEANTGHLERGLKPKREWKLVHSTHTDRAPIPGKELAKYVGEDHALVLRQAISILDKVIRPPRRLRDFELQAYVDRAKLAHELWLGVLKRCQGDFANHADPIKVQGIFEKAWSERAHPYTRDQVQPRNPSADDNGKYLANHPKDGVQRQDFDGRWHHALWQTNKTTGLPDYAATAQAIMRHLFVQELQLNGEPRTKFGHDEDKDKNSGSPELTGKGLIEARGLTIKDSVNDPGMGKRVTKNAVLLNASEEIDSKYFRQDIASLICLAFRSRRLEETSFVPAKVIGGLLYDHLPIALEAANGDENIKKAIWKRHNQVRQFYQKLVRSNRFRRAFSTDEEYKLYSLLPKDTESLKRILDATARNADLSELIRLGKIVAHSADIPLPLADGEALQATFEARLKRFATSAGQSEIKRNETFTRLWRTSVALSLRTLTTWVEPILGTGGDKDKDITSGRFREHVGKLLNNRRGNFDWDHIKVIFGKKTYSALSDHGRSHIFGPEFCPEDSPAVWLERQEIIWALVRLATLMRDATNHFNVRRRLVEKVKNGLLEGITNPDALANRQGNNTVDASVLERLKQLLDFDTDLQRHVLLDDLNAVGVAKYVNGEHLNTLLEELGKGQSDTDFATPKFMDLLRRAANLAQGEKKEYGAKGLPPTSRFLSTEVLRRFAALELTDLSKKKDTSQNDVRIDLFRHLYRTSFPAWLEEERADGDYMKKAILSVLAARAFREEAFAEEQRVVAQGALLRDTSEIDAISDLSTLFATLSANAAGEERLRRASNARAKIRAAARVQSGGRPDTTEKPSWQATLDQDIYGHLFAEYLNQRHLRWIWDIKGPLNDNVTSLTVDDIRQQPPGQREVWESQFYTWLYLVPSDEVSLLRHQLHKTLALDTVAAKLVSGPVADEQDRDTLSRMSRLMALYTSVQEAGFEGNEHVIADAEGLNDIFYADPHQFQDILAKDDHKNTVPGTRRGLRQILKFGHLSAVQRIYEKHRVTQAEIATLIELYEGKRKSDEAEINDFTLRSKLHKEVEILWEKKKQGDKRITDALILAECRGYKESAIKTAQHSFNIAGARLTDHADLHHLMMRVVARLLDFTLTWERDRSFLYLGMLCDRLRTINKDERGNVLSSTLNLEIENPPELHYKDKRGEQAGEQRYAICLNVRALCNAECQNIADNGSPEDQIQQNLIRERRLVRLWDGERGISLDARDVELDLLSAEQRNLFKKYFDKLVGENGKDIAAREDAPNDRPITDHSRRYGAYSYKRPKKQIRNDFAHFNVLAKGRGLNLTYLTNAVRSLVSYDRKLKNAVSTAIADIVFDAGLDIQWTLERDRLKRPSVRPRVVHHLAWLPRVDGKDVSFYLPARSARFTSMVKALFDFDKKGNVEIKTEGTCETGTLGYPRELAEAYTLTTTATGGSDDGGETPNKPTQICLIPHEILTVLKDLPQESSDSMIRNGR